MGRAAGEKFFGFANHFTGIEITDSQMSDKTSDIIKYLLDILKIYLTSCPRVWVNEFKCPQPVYLPKYIMATFDVHKYSFCEINTYSLNKPCIIFFYFFFIPSTAKSLIKCTQRRVPTKGKEI